MMKIIMIFILFKENIKRDKNNWKLNNKRKKKMETEGNLSLEKIN